MALTEKQEVRLDQLEILRPNWDSYGAQPISKYALNIVRTILTNPCQIVPLNSGGIQLEWHVNGVNFEIEIGLNGELVTD